MEAAYANDRIPAWEQALLLRTGAGLRSRRLVLCLVPLLSSRVLRSWLLLCKKKKKTLDLSRKPE